MLHVACRVLKRGKLVEPPSGSTFTSTGPPNLCFDPILEVHVWAFLVQVLENQIEELD